jgi:hypothetical protein
MTDAKASSTTSQAASVMLAAGRLDDSAHSGFHRADDGRWLFVLLNGAEPVASDSA